MSSTQWVVWLDSALGERLQLLDTYSELRLVRNVNGLGGWSLVLPGPVERWSLQIDQMVELWRIDEAGVQTLQTVGFLRSIRAEEEGDSDQLVIGGPDCLALLDDRIVAYRSGSPQAKKSGPADNVMKAIVRENLGSLAEAARDLTSYGFSVEENQSAGPTISKAFAFRNVLEVLVEISDATRAMGTPVLFDVVPLWRETARLGFEFRTYVGQRGLRRTYDTDQAAIFGREWGNLLQPQLLRDHLDERTVVYAGGQGRGRKRRLVQATSDQLGRSPWSRRELFAHATQDATTAELTATAQARLRGQRAQLRFTGQLLSTPQTVYGRDWQLGDLVSIVYNSQVLAGEVRSVRFEVDGSGAETIDARVEVIL